MPNLRPMDGFLRLQIVRRAAHDDSVAYCHSSGNSASSVNNVR
jgi:hypothetical protein